jgi:transposase
MMEEYMGKELANLCNLHRQSVATYVKKFNEGGIDALLERKGGTSCPCFITAEQQNELKQVILKSSPSERG